LLIFLDRPGKKRGKRSRQRTVKVTAKQSLQTFGWRVTKKPQWRRPLRAKSGNVRMLYKVAQRAAA
jgi:hypothetical protein